MTAVINSWRGDALPIAQITRVTPLNVVIGDGFTLSCNGKSVGYTAAASTVDDVCRGLAAALASTSIPEFAEFLASPVDSNGDGLMDYVALVAATAGIPFDVTASATSSTAGTVIVTESTPGHGGINEVHQINLVGSYSGGTFTLTYNVGAGNVTTGNIAWNATAATVQAALVALTGVGAGNVLVTGGPGPNSPWFVTWTGTLGSQSIAAGTINGTNLTGNGGVSITTTQDGNGTSDEIQLIDLSNINGAWNFTLTFNGQTTATLSSGSTPATIQTAIQGLSTVGSGNALVYGFQAGSEGSNCGYFYVHFTGVLANANVSQLVLDATTVADGGTVSTLQQGGQSTSDDFQIVDLGFNGSAVTGTFTLTYGNKTTAPIAANSASPVMSTRVQNALAALSNIGAGNVTVTTCSFQTAIGFGPTVLLVHFNGALANTAANLLSVGSAGLSGGAGTTVTRVSAGHANQNEIQTITVFATGGTFTLTEGAQTTSAIAFNASAATLKTRIEADLSATITTTTTSGAGTVASPYSVTVTAPANTNIAELTANAASLTGGGGTIAELTAGSAGASEVQLVTLEAGVSGGTFALSFNGSAECTPIAWNAAAATVQTDLRALPTVNTVSVSGSAGGPWTVTWSGAQANALQPLLIGDGANLTGTFGTQAVTVSTTTFSAGPNHYDTAANWSRGRVPDTGDSLYCEDGDSGCLYGIAQLCTITANAGTDVITFGKASGDTGGSFVNDQIVQFSNAGGGLPAGISAATNYYLINVDRNAATCQISASSGGSPIDITTAGTGTHTMGVRLDYAEMNSRFTGDVGLPRQNPGGYHEYRPRFLRIGLRAAGTQQIQIGTGDGTGSGKIQFDTGPDQVAGRLVDTGSGSESGIPAVVWKGSHASNVWEIINGNFGCALWAGEVANLGGAKPLILRQGQAELGTGTTVTGPIDQTGGKLISDGATINGQVVLR